MLGVWRVRRCSRNGRESRVGGRIARLRASGVGIEGFGMPKRQVEPTHASTKLESECDMFPHQGYPNVIPYVRTTWSVS